MINSLDIAEEVESPRRVQIFSNHVPTVILGPTLYELGTKRVDAGLGAAITPHSRDRGRS
jgi:hypothetical protein